MGIATRRHTLLHQDVFAVSVLADWKPPWRILFCVSLSFDFGTNHSSRCSSCGCFLAPAYETTTAICTSNISRCAARRLYQMTSIAFKHLTNLARTVTRRHQLAVTSWEEAASQGSTASRSQTSTTLLGALRMLSLYESFLGGSCL